MRHLILPGAIAATTIVALPAHADGYVKVHGTRDSLTWHTDKARALDLASPEGKGVHINRIAPTGRDDLQQGDTIVAVDGQAVAHVVDLLNFANAHLQADRAKGPEQRAGFLAGRRTDRAGASQSLSEPVTSPFVNTHRKDDA